MTSQEIKRRDALAKELERLRIDARFQAAGHRPENTDCDHAQWRFSRYGRCCPCGTCMVDPGD